MRKCLFYAFLLGILSSCQEASEPPLNIAVAANALPALEEIVTAYESETGVRINLISGSSGKLYTQFAQGAPFDLFLSANSSYPQKAFENGHGLLPPSTYAYGELILWGMGDKSRIHLDSLVKLECPIAMANPRHAPYGIAAMEVLDKLGLSETLQEQLVFGESIAQCNQFILSESACIGFSSLASVMIDKYRNTGFWIAVDSSLYSPLDQAMLLLSPSPEAKEFYDFLSSETAGDIFKKYGYRLPPKP